MTIPSTPSYKGFRFPPEIISHTVWLYFRFSLSYRDVEELLAERGVTVTHETVRQWCHKFGQTYANQLRQRRARPGDKWHLDEVFLNPHSAVELAGFDNIAAFVAYKQHASGPSSSSATTKEEAAKQQGLCGPHSPATALDCFRKCDKELNSCCLCAPK